MIKFLSNWIQEIAMAVVISSIFEMIIPNGILKKYIKVVLGIFIIISIISPFTNAKALHRLNVSEAFDKYSENDLEKDLTKNQDSSKKDLEKMYKSTFEKEIVKAIENEGFIVYKCNVKGVFDAEKDNAGISEIKVVLESEKQNKSSDRVKQEAEENSIKIDKVEVVEKVKIGEEKQNNDDKVKAKDIDTLKKFLSKRFEVEKSIIKISVR